MRSFRPLPRTFTCCDHHVQLAATQALQLGQAHAGRVEQLEDREIAHVDELAFPRAHLGHLKQQVDLRAVEIAGQILLELRRADGARRIRVDDLVAMQIAIEAPHRRQRARHRALAEPALGEMRRGSRASRVGRRPASVHAAPP